MTKLFLISCILAFIYLGNVLGFLLLAENIPSLKKTKKMCWAMPFFVVAATCYCVYSYISEKEYKMAWFSIVAPNKMVVGGLSYAKILEKQQEEVPVIEKKMFKERKTLRATSKQLILSGLDRFSEMIKGPGLEKGIVASIIAMYFQSITMQK